MARMELVRFLAEIYAKRMADIGYRSQEIDRMVHFAASRADLYYLALFSRAEKAYDLWGQVLKYATGQRPFDFMY